MYRIPRVKEEGNVNLFPIQGEFISPLSNDLWSFSYELHRQLGTCGRIYVSLPDQL